MNKSAILHNAITQLFEEKKLDAIPDIFTKDYLAHAEDKEYSGHAFIKRYFKQLQTAIPDISVKKLTVLAEEANTVTWQRTLTGTHTNALLGIPASNKKLQWNEMVVSRFEDQKIAEEWVVSELAAQMMFKLPKKK